MFVWLLGPSVLLGANSEIMELLERESMFRLTAHVYYSISLLISDCMK